MREDRSPVIEDQPAFALLHLGGRLLLAAALGALIGAEREFRHKSAGLRTNTLIALGSALFTIMSVDIGTGADDNSRIASQIVTGIGFLGGGAILRTRGTVIGMTTAATIWVNAAVGIAAGAGRFGLAILATVVTLFVLTALQPLEQFFERRHNAVSRTPPSA